MLQSAKFITVKEQLLPNGFQELLKKSHEEGFQFLKRMEDEWKHSINRFTLSGEALFCATLPEREILIGVCGLNQDPYYVGHNYERLRHLYIHPEFRRFGIASQFVRLSTERAKKHFSLLQLRTHNEGAAIFYTKLGFHTVQEKYVTHRFLFS